jgi:hypothetical protein
MREHNYGLQYWLYSVVLHQYLQTRLPDYLFAEHFGGVRYLIASRNYARASLVLRCLVGNRSGHYFYNPAHSNGFYTRK